MNCEGHLLDKAIYHKKEKRKPYTRSKAIDSTCRNHGSCKYCENGRTFSNRKRKVSAVLDMKEYEDSL